MLDLDAIEALAAATARADAAEAKVARVEAAVDMIARNGFYDMPNRLVVETLRAALSGPTPDGGEVAP